MVVDWGGHECVWPDIDCPYCACVWSLKVLEEEYADDTEIEFLA